MSETEISPTYKEFQAPPLPQLSQSEADFCSPLPPRVFLVRSASHFSSGMWVMDTISDVLSLLNNPFLLQVSGLANLWGSPITLCVNAIFIAKVMKIALTHCWGAFECLPVNCRSLAEKCRGACIFLSNFYNKLVNTWKRGRKYIEGLMGNYIFSKIIIQILENIKFPVSFSITPFTNQGVNISPVFSIYCGYWGILGEVASIPVLAPGDWNAFPWTTLQLGPIIIPLCQLSGWALVFSVAGLNRVYKMYLEWRDWHQREIKPVIYFIELV